MATAPFLAPRSTKLGRRKAWLALVVGLMVPDDGESRGWTKADHTGLSVTQTLALTDFDRHPVHLFGGVAQFPARARRGPGRGPQGLWAGPGAGQRLRPGGAWIHRLGLRAPRTAGHRFVVVGPQGAAVWPAACAPSAGAGRRPDGGGDLRCWRPPSFFVHPGRASNGHSGTHRPSKRRCRSWGDGQDGGALTKNAAIFLSARMFYVDGMTAILIYAGVYAHRRDALARPGDAGSSASSSASWPCWVVSSAAGWTMAWGPNGRSRSRLACPRARDHRLPGHVAGSDRLFLAL